MIYTIIEDCSPYYIRFTFDGLNKIIEFVANQDFKKIDTRIYKAYIHHNFNKELAQQVLSMLPMALLFDFKQDRVAIFETPPGQKNGIHKDGIDTKVSFNIPIQILDSNCLTSWFSDEELSDCDTLDPDALPYARKPKEFSKRIRTPSKTLIVKPNEFILFNTDIWHRWDNSKSTNVRKILTLRLNNHSLDFNTVRNMLFAI
jgi:hypothetical protein